MALNIIIVPNKFTETLRDLAVVPDRQIPLFVVVSQLSSSKTPKTIPLSKEQTTNLRPKITPRLPILRRPYLLVLPPGDRARNQVFELFLRDEPFVAFEDEVLEDELVAPGTIPCCFAVDDAGLVGHDFAWVGDGYRGREGGEGEEGLAEEGGETHFSVIVGVSVVVVVAVVDLENVGVQGR